MLSYKIANLCNCPTIKLPNCKIANYKITKLKTLNCRTIKYRSSRKSPKYKNCPSRTFLESLDCLAEVEFSLKHFLAPRSQHQSKKAFFPSKPSFIQISFFSLLSFVLNHFLFEARISSFNASIMGLMKE